jgi:hypothetical protein
MAALQNQNALRWIEGGCKVKLKADNTMDRIEHPDWHTPSWLTASELERCIDTEGYVDEYKAILAAMKSLESSGNDVRLVFWFDN